MKTICKDKAQSDSEQQQWQPSASGQLEELVHVLFLNLSWEDRQQAKHMMTEQQRQLLGEVLQGEPNW